MRLTSSGADISRIEALLLGGIEERAFPGAAYAFGTSDTIDSGAVGRLTYDENSSLANTATLFDLASLTKVLVTTTSAMTLHQDGALDLDASVHSILQGFEGGGKEDVKVRHLLTHNSGLPGIAEFWRVPGTVTDRLAAVLKEPLVRPAGSQVEYSCVGFLVLQQVLQAITGERYDEAWTWPFFRIVGSKGWSFCFNPPESRWRDCAPTEVDAETGVALVGQVHDENARSLGGIAGNAGIFGTVEDVAGFAQMLLRGGDEFLSPDVLSAWTKRQQDIESASTRALGWATKAMEKSSAGTRMGPTSFGHLGFTGTSVWIDPERDFFAALLTNRVHPTREGPLLLPWRSKYADLAFDAVVLS